MRLLDAPGLGKHHAKEAITWGAVANEMSRSVGVRSWHVMTEISRQKYVRALRHQYQVKGINVVKRTLRYQVPYLGILLIFFVFNLELKVRYEDK